MLAFIQKIVRQAGEILWEKEINPRISRKTGKRDIVTNADMAVQNFLQDQLQEAVPTINFIGEETQTTSVQIAGPFCIVDPIDGTMNFSHGVHHSCISLAYGENGVVTHACVYNPYLNEMFTAQKDKGAYLNTIPLVRSKAIALADSLVCFGTASYYADCKETVFSLAKIAYEQAIDIRRTGSAALDLCYIAANRFDLFFEPRLAPWDYAAASLIIQEAGGAISNFQREPVALDQCDSVIAGSQKAVAEFLPFIDAVIMDSKGE